MDIDQVKKEFANIVLYPDRSPKEIDFYFRERDVQSNKRDPGKATISFAIYELNGNRLRVCMPTVDQERNRERPTTFTEKQTYDLLKRYGGI